MKILAIDTATENCSAAIYNDGEITHRAFVSPREHTQRILPMVDELLVQSDLKLQQFDALAYGQGPGSFTGVRIGIGIAQGLAFGADLPMIGISTLAAMAQSAIDLDNAELVFSAIDARMSEIYWASYRKNAAGLAELIDQELVIKPELLTLPQDFVINDLSKTIAIGTGWQTYKELLTTNIGDINISTSAIYSEARYMLALAKAQFEAGNTVAAEFSEPVYLRDKVTWKKLPGRE